MAGLASMRRLAAGIGIFALALAFRLIEFADVFTKGGVFPPNGADEYYHLRRIWYSVVNFPAVLERDPYMAFPAGGEVMWPPGFDLAIAGLARLLVGPDDQAAVEVIAAWVPPILGALTCVAAAAIAARVFSPAAGALAGISLALLPGHYFYSLVGMVDHHCAVALSGALLVLGALHVARREPQAEWLGLGAGLALGAAAFLLIWPGALLQVALLQGLATVWMLQSPSREVAIGRARRLALSQALAAAAIAPYALGRDWIQFGSWSPLVLSNFQPAWFLANAVACLLLSHIWAAIRPLGAAALSRWVSALGLAVAALVLGLVAIPGLAASLDLAAGWFRGDEEFLTGIVEMLPLFADVGNGQWWGQRAERLMTRFVFVYPIPLLWLLAKAFRTRRADLWFLVVWSAMAYVQALAQTRFINSFSVSYVIVSGAAAVAFVAEVRSRLAERRFAIRAVAAAAGLAVLVAGVQPAASFMMGIARVLESDAPARSSYRQALLYRGVGEWLAAHTPVTAGYLDAGQTPEYGVLARWDRGHLLRYESERPVVQDNFGLYAGREQFDAADAYFGAETEGKARRILETLGVRYVVTDGAGSGRGTRYSARSMARRLYPYPAAEALGRKKLPPLRLSGFRHHRLLLETQPGRLNVRFLRVFERVAGARIEGAATPHGVVSARLEVISPSRPEAANYQSSIRVGDDGRYSLRVPYSTSSSLGVETGESYRLSCGKSRESAAAGSVAVSEAAVLSGEVVEGPSLVCD